jgi:hypothetical protein
VSSQLNLQKILLSASPFLSVFRSATTRARLNEFLLNLILGSFTKMCQHFPILVDIYRVENPEADDSRVGNS